MKPSGRETHAHALGECPLQVGELTQLEDCYCPKLPVKKGSRSGSGVARNAYTGATRPLLHALGLNPAAVTGALGALGRVYQAVAWLIAAGLAIGRAIWAVRSMSVQVAILVGAAIITGAMWLTRR